ILFVALAARFILVLYSNIHDYMFHVNFTDIDYSVYSDAAKHVAAGRSPFERETYRYTPALAWILLPVNSYKDFGKYLFCIFDIIVGWLYFRMMPIKNGQNVDDVSENWTIQSVVIFWLANPLTAVISARNWKGLAFAVVLRLIDDDELLSKLVGFLAFLPQMGLVLYFSFSQEEERSNSFVCRLLDRSKRCPTAASTPAAYCGRSIHKIEWRTNFLTNRLGRRIPAGGSRREVEEDVDDKHTHTRDYTVTIV
ncbi:hypothetical protein TELCIR_09957, partial [Teladorsagia circumcincta]